MLPVLDDKLMFGDHWKLLAPLAVKVALVPKHMLAEETLITGLGINPTVKLAMFVQVAADPITVPLPIPADCAMAVIMAPDVVFGVRFEKPLQLYVLAPDAVRVTVFTELLKLLAQMVGLLNPMLTTGNGTTVTFTAAVPVQVDCSPIRK